jgi:hypothetical protein
MAGTASASRIAHSRAVRSHLVSAYRMTSSPASPGSPRDATFVLTRPPLVWVSGGLPVASGRPPLSRNHCAADRTPPDLRRTWHCSWETARPAPASPGQRGRRRLGPALKDGCCGFRTRPRNPPLAPVTDHTRPAAPALVRSGSPGSTRAPVIRGPRAWRTVASVARRPPYWHPANACRPLAPGQVPPAAGQCPPRWSRPVGHRSAAVIRRSPAARFHRTPGA